ncbi:MAG: TetR/AcrR family transcriptional regulator [Capsulimonas sp.]|uniref:TetR/AcrR family transcriptional regulator n=1 Tax=Capsulimonas sp. TaxID=2494211 RepID=UPI0032657CDE
MEKVNSRERILEAAAIRIRKAGLDSLTGASLADELGLAPEVIDNCFPSRAALTEAATERALLDGELQIDERIGFEKDPTVAEIVDAYFHPDHIANPELGCGLCALAGDVRRANAEIQSLVTRHLRDNAALLAQAAGGDPAAHAWSLGALSALVGAVTLARAVNDPALTQSILEETRKLIAPKD